MFKQSYEGRAGLITGGASGIGRAAAIAFLEVGAAVVIADVQADLGEALAQELRGKGGRVVFTHCDVADEGEVAAAVGRVVSEFGACDFAFNNAGIDGPRKKTADFDSADWDRMMTINLRGVFLCMKHELKAMLTQGRGSIVNTSSIAGLVGGGRSAYTASKHGVVGLTKAAAIEYATSNIRVNAVCPGLIQTPMLEQFGATDPAAYALAMTAQPIGRLGKAEEIANAAVWLCSDLASLVTGQAIAVDGGYVAR